MNCLSRLSLTGCVLAALAVFTSAHAQTPIKTGLWEETSTVKRGGGEPRSVTIQNCLTEQILDQSKFDRLVARVKNNKSCQLRDLKHTDRIVSSEWECTSEHVNMHGRGELVFDDDAHFHLSSEEHSIADGRAIDTVVNVSSRWLSADCGTVKPLK